jgi:hypothetical protein
VLSAAHSQALVIASEAFDYPDGSINGRNGGTGWGTPWSGLGIVSGGELSSDGNDQNFRTLSSVISHSPGTAIFLSFDMSADAGQNNDFAGISFFNGAQEEIFFGLSFNTNNFGINWSGFYNGDSGIAVNSTTRHLVAEILFGAATTTANLYIDPGAVLGTPDDTFTLGTATLGGSWDRVRVFGHPPGVQSLFDNIVISVPEPMTATLFLFGLGLIRVGSVRRKS